MQPDSTYQDYLDTFYAFAPTEPEILGAVYQRDSDGCRESLVLQFANKSLVITAHPDDDTIRVHVQDGPAQDLPDYERIDASELWHALLGKSFGWGWVTINQQGYCDGVLLSFDGIDPTIMLNVVASSITVRRILNEEREPVTTSHAGQQERGK